MRALPSSECCEVPVQIRGWIRVIMVQGAMPARVWLPPEAWTIDRRWWVRASTGRAGLPGVSQGGPASGPRLPCLSAGMPVPTSRAVICLGESWADWRMHFRSVDSSACFHPDLLASSSWRPQRGLPQLLRAEGARGSARRGRPGPWLHACSSACWQAGGGHCGLPLQWTDHRFRRLRHSIFSGSMRPAWAYPVPALSATSGQAVLRTAGASTGLQWRCAEPGPTPEEGSGSCGAHAGILLPATRAGPGRSGSRRHIVSVRGNPERRRRLASPPGGGQWPRGGWISSGRMPAPWQAGSSWGQVSRYPGAGASRSAAPEPYICWPSPGCTWACWAGWPGWRYGS